MNMKPAIWFFGAVALLHAQGTSTDYARAQALRERFPNLAIDVAGPANWIGDTGRFWYRKTVQGGHEFVLVDTATLSKKPAFDHAGIAASLSAADAEYKAATLPFSDITFVDNQSAIEFDADAFTWKCTLADSTCKKGSPVPASGAGGRGGQGRGPDAEDLPYPSDYDADLFDYPQQTQGGGRGGRGSASEAAPIFKPSPDEKWEALIQNYNVFIRPKGKADSIPLSLDGSEGNYYTLQSVAWSPDSTHLAAYRVRPGYDRQVYYVESSPTDQLQPKHSSRFYRKPGDAVDIDQPVLFDVVNKKQFNIDSSLFPNPFTLSRLVWWKDSRGFTFQYNQRGHQMYRVIEVDAANGIARALITEESRTFIDYSPMLPNPRGNGSLYRHDVNDGKETVWSSERDGWKHLYLYDGVTGKVKNQITKGSWIVRSVEKVDDEKRQIWFQAAGLFPGRNPYYAHFYRINFDGSGLTALTSSDGDHTVTFSPDRKYYVDSWSRVNLAPISELHRTEDGKRLLELERGDTAPLEAAGWHAPEAFSAMGRDGKTDIWGVIFRPSNFDPSKKYPVIENIYAGPQGSFAPTAFSPLPQTLAELGFIVVQIDGMGTTNRSRAFHDVAYRNIGDAGFPDRILWHQAVAAKYQWYDISRVGIYGTSAGGQNALGALLFHPAFYKAAVANSGCHDNRMDKIWWNEQWMGWPLGPHYAASSNVDNAYRLQGKLQLVVPELDTNVDPSSTLQVVNALIKAKKKFDLLVVPGADHGARGASAGYVEHMLQDFFVHNLLGVEPPDWNETTQATNGN